MALHRMYGLVQKKKAIDGLLGRWAGRQSGPASAHRALPCTHRCRHVRCAVETLTTQVLNNDNSQMVLIPAEFRIDTDCVRISRNEAGDLVIHPRRVPRGEALLQALTALGEVDDAFVAALGADQQDVLPMQERKAL